MDPSKSADAQPTARTEEIVRFNRLAATWWDASGPMRPLHVVNALRLDYALGVIARRFARPPGKLDGLRVADVGCGAGLASEPLSARGAHVVGIDAAEKNIAAARLHAAAGGLAIDYRVGEPATALGGDERFDVLLMLEVVEHVNDVAGFVAECARRLSPGGVLFASTINRTLRSLVVAIICGEYLFRVLPAGTHRFRQLVRPDELQKAALACGLEPLEQRGMRYLPVLHRAWWTADLSVNYLAVFGKPA